MAALTVASIACPITTLLDQKSSFALTRMSSAPNPPWATAALRNREPILGFIKSILPAALSGPLPTGTLDARARAHALEVASGTGAHLALNADALPRLLWHPTDLNPDGIASEALQQDNVVPAQVLNAAAVVADWPSSVTEVSGGYSLVLCVNMIHIAPKAATTGLLRGAGQLLASDGVLVLYGPFFEEDVPTAHGNVQFDESLRSRNPQWGVRRLNAVAYEATEFGLTLWKRQAMPANNLCLAFKRTEHQV